MAQPAPRYVTEVAWDADPFSDPTTWTWTDLTRRLRNTAKWKNGKQSPFARSEPCQGTFEFDDRDRAFDPNNTGSPYYPGNTKARRPIRVRAVWDQPGAATTDAYGPRVKSDLRAQGAWYRLSRATPIDEQRHADGVGVSVTTGVAGAIVGDTAYQFNGSSSRVDIADAAGWLRFTTEMSVEAWVSPSGSGNRTIFYKPSPAGHAYSLFLGASNDLHFKVTDTGGTDHDCFGGTLTPGVYSHVVGTFLFGGSELRVYVNSAEVARITGLAITARNGVGTANIGSVGSGFYFNGAIDEVALYNYALPATVVAEHYALRDYSNFPLYRGYFNRATRQRVGRDATALVESTGILGVLGGVKLPGSPVEFEIRKANPAAWWRLAEQSFTDPLADQVGRYPGRYEGEPQMGQACVPFSGLGGFYPNADGQMRARIPVDAAIVPGYPFTVAGWFLADQNKTDAFRYIFRMTDPDNQYIYSSYLVNDGFLGDTPPTRLGGRFVASLLSPGPQQRRSYTSRPLDDGQPHFVAVRFLSASALEIVVDGVNDPVVLFNTGTPSISTWDQAIIGNANNGDFGDFRSYSRQAEWQVYTRSLSDAECLAQYQAGVTGWDGDLSGVRLRRLLAGLDVHAFLYNVDNGDTAFQGGLLTGNNYGDYIQTIGRSEAGGLYETKDGTLRFRRRLALLYSPYTVSAGTFGNAGGSEIPFEELVPVNGVDRIVNRARIGRAGGTVVERFDQASIDTNGERGVEYTDLLFDSDNTATDYADWTIQKNADPIAEFESFVLEVSAGSDEMTGAALTRQIEDRITLKDRPPGGGTVTMDVNILGEEWTLTRGKATCKWYLAKTDQTQYFTLDDTTKGRLNGGYPLAF